VFRDVFTHSLLMSCCSSGDECSSVKSELDARVSELLPADQWLAEYDAAAWVRFHPHAVRGMLRALLARIVAAVVPAGADGKSSASSAAATGACSLCLEALAFLFSLLLAMIINHLR
jgi:hypothetical protein